MVFVLGKYKQPLMPCSEKRARKLLTARRAVVHRMYPFTIRLKDRITGDLQSVRVKIDPGSKQTGIAVVREEELVDSDSGEIHRRLFVLALLQLNHRGSAICGNLKSRASLRWGRRNRHTRYRPSRFNNRKRVDGWLAPSLNHRVDTVIAWVNKLIRLCPITAITQELVKFDMQRMANPEISGIEYRQGQLAGYEVREYLLEKHKRECAYCGAKNVPLEIEHIVPRSRGGTNRVGNLTLSCRPCNAKKGNMYVEEFLRNKPDVLKRVKKGMSSTLKDASVVNATRWKLYRSLKATELPVETGSGAQTKFNRVRLGIPKEHALDAVCAGTVLDIENWRVPTLMVKCSGRGRYRRTLTDKYGFPRATMMKTKSVYGFQTGDICKATVTTGKYKGNVYTGRVVVRATGQFDIYHNGQKYGTFSYKCFKLIQKNDGYGYGWNKPNFNLDMGSVIVDVDAILSIFIWHYVRENIWSEVLMWVFHLHVSTLRDETQTADEIKSYLSVLMNETDEDVEWIVNQVLSHIAKYIPLYVTKSGELHVKHVNTRILKLSIN